MSTPAPSAVAAPAGDETLAALDGVPGLPLGGEPPTPTPEPGRGRLRRFWFVPAGVALLGAAALVPSVGSSGPGAGEARVLVDGVAVVTDVDGGTTTVRDDRVDVGPGDEVAVTEGRATFEMAGDVRLEGLGAHDGRDGTTVEMAIAPKLVTGRLLTVAPTPIEIEAGDTTVAIGPAGSADGVAHLDRRLGLGVGTYRGDVAVETAGRGADVARYRRVEVAAPGALGPDGLPLRYEADDAWDRRYLGEALTIDAQIAPLLTALGQDGGDEFLAPATLREAVPGVPADGDLGERLADLDDGGTALVLAAIASTVDERPFAEAWDRADSFHDDGAPWGLTALDQGAQASDVLPVLRAALDTVDLQAPTADDGAAGADARSAGGGDGTTGGATQPGSAGSGGGTPSGGPTDGADAGGATPPPSPTTGGTTDPGSGGPTVPAPTVPVPSVPLPTVPGVPPLPPVPSVPEVVDGVGGTLGETVDGVTDIVDGAVPGLGTMVDDTVGGLGDLVGGLGAGLEGLGTRARAAVAPAVDPLVAPLLTGVGETVDALGTGLSTAVRTPTTG